MPLKPYPRRLLGGKPGFRGNPKLEFVSAKAQRVQVSRSTLHYYKV